MKKQFIFVDFCNKKILKNECMNENEEKYKYSILIFIECKLVCSGVKS
jgi:hypothetical protein